MKLFVFFLLICSTLGKPIYLNEEKCLESKNKNTNSNIFENITITNDNLNCSLKENNITCSLCKSLVYTIDYGIIKGNNTIQEITQILKDICCTIHGPSGKECVFILNNIQKIVKYISNGLTSLQICEKLHFCK